MLTYFLSIFQNTLNSLVYWYRKQNQIIQRERGEGKQTQKKWWGLAGAIHTQHDAEC